MRTGGFPHVVHRQDWENLVAEYSTAPAVVSPVAQIVTSVVAAGRAMDLVFTTSMWDLIVTPNPVGDPPVDGLSSGAVWEMRNVAPTA